MADDLQGFRQGARHVVDTEEQDKFAAFAFRRFDIAGPGKDGEAGRIILAFIDVVIQDLQAVQAGCLFTGNGSQGGVLALRYDAGGNGCIDLCLDLETMLPDKGLALIQRLGMADDGPDLVCPGSGYSQQVMHDGERVDTIDKKASAEHEVHDLSHLPGVTVLNGQDRVIALTFHYRQIGVLKGGIGNKTAVREDPFRGDMGKGAFRTAEGHNGAADQTLLVFSGNVPGVLQECPGCSAGMTDNTGR